MDCSTPGLPVHHQLPESTQAHVHRRLTSRYRLFEVFVCVLLCVCTIASVCYGVCVIVCVFSQAQITFLNKHCFCSWLREVAAPGLALEKSDLPCAWSTFNLEKCPKCPPLGLHSVPLCHPSPQQSFISQNQDLPGKSSFVVLGMFGFLGNPC